MPEPSLISAVHAASTREEVLAAVHAIYADLQQQIDQRRPLCQLSGRCCHFDDWGHRLYVTTMELAAFIADRTASPQPPSPPMPDPPPGDPHRGDGRGCPFQANRLCGVHRIRPFGCRIYFCDSTAQDWQQDQYQHFHARLRRLHDEFAVPYFYVEWRQALAALSLV